MAGAMAPPHDVSAVSDHSVAELFDTCFQAMMHRQVEQFARMQLQNQQLANIIATLQRGNNK